MCIRDRLGDDVSFDEQNAAGDASTCSTICTKFVTNDYDLILGNATAALQAASAATDSIPILGTSITDYATALDMSDWSGTTGKNISGTTDLAPLDEQAKCIKELFPDAKNIGIIYCSSEPNSIYQSTTITKYLEDEGYTVKAVSYTHLDVYKRHDIDILPHLLVIERAVCIWLDISTLFCLIIIV